MADQAHLPLELAYHCKLLDTLAGTAIGLVNVTTIEAKLQNMYGPEEILAALLDADTSLDVALPLAGNTRARTRARFGLGFDTCAWPVRGRTMSSSGFQWAQPMDIIIIILLLVLL